MKIISKIINNYNNLKISHKLLLSLILISIFPVMIIQIISYASTTQTMKRQLNEMISLNLKQSYNSLDSFIETYSSIAMNIYTNDLISKNLNNINVWDNQYYSAINTIRDQLKNSVFLKDGVLGVAVVAVNGQIAYYDSVSLSNVDSFCLDIGKVRNTPMYKDAFLTKEIVYGDTCLISSKEYGDKYIFYLSKQLVDFNDLEKGAIGAVIISIDEESLAKAYMQDNSNDWASTFVTDSDGNILSFPLKQYIGKNIYDYSEQKDVQYNQAVEEFVKKINLMDTKRLIINSTTKENSNFVVVDVRDEEQFFGDVRNTASLIVALGLSMIGFATVVITYTSNTMNKTVKKIIEAINKANDGDLEVQVDIKGKDEFAKIAYNFNNMISEIKNLIAKENEAAYRQKEAEIRALEAQINPHFLYNTLDAINWMAIENNEHEISKMLKNLAIILRYSINNSNEIVYLSEELKYLKKYIFLQQRRFNYSFECLIKVPEEVTNIKIHKLLIQPLIENTLVHGFPGPTGYDKIEVEIESKDDEFLIINITDNGKGMSDELIESFNSYDYQTENIKSSIGIRNVISRIKMYYGDYAKFIISQNQTCGTSIEIMIPYQKSEGEEL